MYIITATWINNLGYSTTMHQYASSYLLAVKLGDFCLTQLNCSITIEEK